MTKKSGWPNMGNHGAVIHCTQDVSRLNDRLKALVGSIGIITSCTTVEELGREFLKEFALALGAKGGSLYLMSEEALVLAHTLGSSHAQRSIPLPLPSSSVFGQVLERKVPLRIEDIQAERDLLPSGWEKYENGSLMAFPLLDNHEKVLGLVTLHDKVHPPFTAQDHEIGTILVSFCCEALKSVRAMNALQESEAKFRNLVENMNDAVYSLDGQGRITYMSPVMEKMTGYAVSDGRGVDFKLPFNSREASQLEENFEKCLQGKPTGNEYLMYKKSGEPIWVRTASQPIWKGDRVIGLQGILTDITEFKETEQHLEKRAAQLAIMNRLGKAMGADLSVNSAVKTAFEHVHEAVESDFSILFLKEGDRLLPQYSAPVEDLFPGIHIPEHRPGECLCGIAVQERRAVYSVDINVDPRCIHDECKIAKFHSFAALPLLAGKEIVGVLGIASRGEKDFQDLAHFLEALCSEIAIGLKNAILYENAQNDARELKAQLKKIQESETEKRALTLQLQQTQKMEAIGTLAGGIAHDFNNILGGMIGYTELALFNILERDEKVRGYLNKLLSSCNRAKDLVQQILKFSRRDDSAMGCLSVLPIVKESLKLLRSTLPAYIEIRERFEANADQIVGDPTQIHQVIMNLCTNAYHAIRHGGRLTVSLENETFHEPRQFMALEAPPGDYLKLMVSDTGHGIPMDTLPRIFEPYFTTKNMNEGTGLGLSVVLGIVKSHNGLMHVESRAGRGCRFHVYLPLSTEKPQITGHPAMQGFPNGNGERILVVDDEEFFVGVIKEHLEGIGYHVTACQSSREILKIFKKNPRGFDLLITDQAMPEMTGVQLVSEIRKLNQDVPVVLCTGYSEIVSEQTIKHYRVDGFLPKPVSRRDLAAVVHELLV